MKKVILFILLTASCYVTTVRAQYQSFFGNNHTSWNMVDRNVNGDYITDSLSYDKDTIISGLMYKKVFWFYDNYLSRTSFFREDTTTGKLWHFCPNCGSMSDTTEKLIIDMSLNVGNPFTFEIGSLGPYTLNVDSIFFLNSKKNILFNSPPLAHPFIFIEGVGASTILGYNKGFGVQPILLCQNKDENIIYVYPHTNPLFIGKCHINISDVKGINVSEHEYAIFPNPVKDMLQIEFTESAPREIAIRNVVGQEIFRKSTKCRNMKINTTGWELGVYYVCVFDRVVGYPAKKVVIE